jgi:hypothetical protein
VVATGGTFATRALRTDADEALFTVEKPVMITSVGEVISRSDLADRAVIVTLDAIPEHARKTKQAFTAAIDAARPRILGALLDGVSHGLRELPNVRLARLPRMADFITWAEACARAYWPAGAIQAAFGSNNAYAVEGVLEGDTVAVALRKWFAAHGEPWEGTMEGLLSLVNAWAEPEAKRQRNWPTNPSMLSARITMMADHLGKVGIVVEKHRGKTKRSVTIKTTA